MISMANYTQTNRNVSSSYYNFFLSQVPLGKDYIIFGDETYYYCVYGDYNGSLFNESTVLKIARTNNNGSVITSSEASTSVTITYEYYAYSNIGTGTYLIQPQAQNLMNTQINYIGSFVFILLIVTIGFSIIKKRWI